MSHQVNNRYGENIATGYPDAISVVNVWSLERQQYDYNNPGFSSATGHFTQVVWKATGSIGCASVDCGRRGSRGSAFGKFVVCEYTPRGNIIGNNGQYFRENVGRQVKGSPGDKYSGQERNRL